MQQATADGLADLEAFELRMVDGRTCAPTLRVTRRSPPSLRDREDLTRSPTCRRSRHRMRASSRDNRGHLERPPEAKDLAHDLFLGYLTNQISEIKFRHLIVCDCRCRSAKGLIIVSARAIIMRLNVLSLCALLGLMTAHKTTHCRAYDSVVASIVTSHASYDSPLEATPG